MLKLLFVAIMYLSYHFIQNSVADCPDDVVYCFDSNKKILGELFIGQLFYKKLLKIFNLKFGIIGLCYNWKKIRCEPCGMMFDAGKKINNSPYIKQCRENYPKATFVLSKSTFLFYKVDGVTKYRFKG
jgi:hypothetical protein